MISKPKERYSGSVVMLLSHINTVGTSWKIILNHVSAKVL